jgi:hypothetical protein
LAFLAGALRDHELRGVDPNLPGAGEAAVLAACDELEPELIAVSLRNIDSQMLRDLHYYVPPFEALLRRLRERCPHAGIVVGGAGFSLFPLELMRRNPEIDIGVRLEGEHVLARLAQGEDPAGLPACYYRRNGEIRTSSPGPFFGFPELPRPDWTLLDPAAYAHQRGAIGIQTKRGCNLNCAYCTYPMLNGRAIRRRPVDEVVDEIAALAENHGVQHFTFVDSIFNLPEDHAWEIVERLRERRLGVRWSAWFNERPLSESFIRAAIAAGCEEFSFSPDAFNDRALAALQKNIRVADIEKTLSLFQRIPEMRVSFNFFINPPGNDLRTTLRVIGLFLRSKTVWRRRVTGFVLASPRVEPDTAIYARAVKEGVVDPAAPLLPDDVEGLRALFYANPGTPYVELAFRAYIRLWQWKQRLAGRRP